MNLPNDVNARRTCASLCLKSAGFPRFKTAIKMKGRVALGLNLQCGLLGPTARSTAKHNPP
jgi:hypothetical protein